MKHAWLLPSLFLIIGLNSGCALAMGSRRSCDGEIIPTRPQSELCIANGDGRVSCFNPGSNPRQYVRPLIENADVCINHSDYLGQEEWIKSVLDTCRRQ